VAQYYRSESQVRDDDRQNVRVIKQGICVKQEGKYAKDRRGRVTLMIDVYAISMGAK
jgi:hypothetical protein